VSDEGDGSDTGTPSQSISSEPDENNLAT